MASESEDTKANPVETVEEQDIDSSVIPRKGSKLSRVQKLRRRLSQSFGRLAALAKDSSTEKPPKSRNRPFPNGFSDEYLDRLDGPDQLQKGWVHLRLSAGNGLDEVGQDPVVSNLCRHSQYASDSRLLDGPPISTTPIHVATPTRPNDPPTTRDSGLGSGSASGSAGDLRDKETWSSGVQVILRRSKKKPARPRSEVLTSQVLVAVGAGNGVEATKGKVPERDPQLVSGNRRSKRYSAFGGDSPFGKLEAYVKLEPLGEGSYATVYKGYSNLTGQIVALKEIRLQAEEGAPFTAIREASLLKELKHANIVTLHDIVHTPQSLTFVFEFVASDLSQYLERHPGGLQPNNVRLLLYQLLRGLAFVHKRKVLHRDLKPQNLLITNNGELKLADFGLARAQSVPSHTYSPEVVTLWYRPPDVLLGLTEYGPPLDMWGVGCIFLEMLTGAPAFPGVRDAYDQLDRIWRVLGTPTEATWPGVSSLPLYKPQRFRFHRGVKLGHAFPRLYDVNGAEALALKLLQLQPNSRLTALSAMQHKFFQDLPAQLEHLSEDASIFSVSGIVFVTEERRLPPSVYRAAQDLRRKQ